MTAHLERPKRGNVFQQIYLVAKEPNHLIAFAFIALQMMAGFSVIPYLALYMTANIGLPESFITVIYLCGGTATFFSARFIGKMADRYGKARVFKWVALASFVPVLIATHLGPVPWWVALANATIFFVLVSGRMIPGMAMVSSAAAQPIRGTFMSLVSTAQMMSSGLASLVAGLIITRSAGGQIEHYNIVGYLAVASGFAAIWMMQRLKVAQA
jgi:predicted MFS family arabinose efflux permease